MKLPKTILLFALIPLIFSCSKEGEADPNSSFKTSNFAATINPDDLVGEWNLSAMQADTLVDLNKDGTGDTNLLNESSCFNDMKVIFNQDRTFSTTNARLDFNGGTNNVEFVCVKNRVDFGTWDIEGSDLLMDITIDGTAYTQRKPLNYNTSTFAFDVSKAESNVYVNDPGDTSASKIRILALEYTRI
ncbi:uncharacterized protein DUF5004 [Gillisia sp. Hel_I_86]|uniref:DUF5004 domain-containing protein n=1 Tax=Gillisia sp. Hel_I_86 TaxID=1249981 RepID=UPI00119B165F|nr:DUF5004 domain-containing protein [Gillisia sp. Hel_I_86]TVZ25800.1 uncharacterized protein DUF5004 [Gillisia sp. Hel_I_86]